MSKSIEPLIQALNYGENVQELKQSDFDTSTGNVKNTDFSKGVVVVSFGSNYCRYCINMQNEYAKFATDNISNKSVRKVTHLNVSTNLGILETAKSNNWPYKLDQFPTIIFFADGKPCYHHRLDYTYKSFNDSLSKVNGANPQCSLI